MPVITTSSAGIQEKGEEKPMNVRDTDESVTSQEK